MSTHVFYNILLFLVPVVVSMGALFGTFQNRCSRNKKQIFLAMGVGIFTMFFILVISLRLYLPSWEFLYVILTCGAAIAVCKYIFRCQITELLFVFLIVKCYMDSIFSISKFLQYHFFLPKMADNQMNTFCIAYATAFVITLYPMWMIIRRLLRPLINKTEYMKFWYMAWLLPFFYYLLYRYGVSPHYVSPERIMRGSESFVPILWVVAVFLSIIVMAKMMLEATCVVEEREKRKSAELQLIMQREQYQKIQKGVEYAHKLNHDQRHHFLAISGYAQKQDIDGLKQYLVDYQDTMLPKEYLMVCDNYAINAVAQHMLQRVLRKGTKIETSIDIPEDCGVAQSDLVVLIGNLLENAAEACERQKEESFLSVKASWASENVFVLLLKNSYSGNIKEKNGIFLSSKRNKEGIGISSVREIAEKYHGVAKFEYNNKKGIFKASILLNL